MEMTFNTYTLAKGSLENFLPFNSVVSVKTGSSSTAASYLMPFVSKQLHDPDGSIFWD